MQKLKLLGFPEKICSVLNESGILFVSDDTEDSSAACFELEYKLKINDAPFDKLEKLGFVSQGKFFERNTLFDNSQGIISNLGAKFRVRTFEGLDGSGNRHSLLTLKKSIGSDPTGAKQAHEFESELARDKQQQLEQALQVEGYFPALVYERKREYFIIPGQKNVEVVVDEMPYIGLFLEVEGEQDECLRVLKELNFNSKDAIPYSYLKLLKKHFKNQGKSIPTEFCFL